MALRKQRSGIWLGLLAGGLFGAYFLANLFESIFWADLFAAACGLWCTGVAFWSAWKSRAVSLHRAIFLCIGLACLSWLAADTILAFYDLIRGYDAAGSLLIPLLYLLNSIFIFAGLMVFALYQFRKWNRVQLLLDITIYGLASFYFFYILFFRRDPANIVMVYTEGWIPFLTILLDMVIFVALTIWYLSVRSGSIPLATRIITCGLFLFIFIDVLYYYLYFYDLSIPDAAIDSVYMAGLFLFSGGACLETRRQQEGGWQQSGVYNNEGYSHISLFILVCPLTVSLLQGFLLSDWLVFSLLTLLHEAGSTQIQTAIITFRLLRREKESNRILEERIAERTRELVTMNQRLMETIDELDYLSNQDTVTDLYNRRFFLAALEERLRLVRDPESLAVIFLDLDRFKIINDTYGHDTGDQVLKEIAGRLNRMVEKDGFLARMGGDEFVFAFHGRYGYKEIEDIAGSIIAACHHPIHVGQYVFHVTLSLGISIYPLDAGDSNTLMKHADIAMYHAKQNGCNTFVSFNTIFSDEIQRKNEIEMLLRQADFDREFQLNYQPQFSAADKKLTGIEALLRWQPPGYDFISPAEFIPVAEEIDLIVPIGAWVMRQAVRQIACWNTTYGLQLKMGINISPKQLDNAAFIGELRKTMQNSQIKTDWLDIEITENIAIEGEFRITEISRLFSDLGVSVSVDDFGTGYSSLSYLKLLPFNRIKIAKPLLDNMATDHYDLQIVKAIVLLAKSIGIRTIAEGVELPEQLELLVELGCEEVQGYLLGQPVSAAIFEQIFLADNLTSLAVEDHRYLAPDFACSVNGLMA